MVRTIVAAAPLFRVGYRIDTPLQGRLREIGDWVHAHWPRLVSFPVIGIGSPMSDNCALGFAPELSDADCAHAFDGLLLPPVRNWPRPISSALLAVKSLDRSAETLDGTLRRHGYKCVTSVPLAMLDLPYHSLDHYLDSLPDEDRLLLPSQDAQRKEGAHRISLLDRGHRGRASPNCSTARSSRARSTTGISKSSNSEYFPKGRATAWATRRSSCCAGRATNSSSFQLFLVGRNRVLAKQIGMQYPQGRELNLYFVNWLKLIEFAIERRIPCVEMGATTYATKILFGGYLERRWLHFRFRGSIGNRLLNPVAPLFDFEKNDPELAKLDGSAKTYMGPRLSRLAQRGNGAPEPPKTPEQKHG